VGANAESSFHRNAASFQYLHYHLRPLSTPIPTPLVKPSTIKTLTLFLDLYIVRTLVGDSRIGAAEDDRPRPLNMVTEGWVGLPTRAIGTPELWKWEARERRGVTRRGGEEKREARQEEEE